MQLNSRPVPQRLGRILCTGLAALALAGGVLSAAPLSAQSLFSPAITVNDEVITNFELQQRIQFLTLLRAPGNPEELARKQLIEDKLRSQAIAKTDITVTEEQIQEGIAEFAKRTELSADDFVKALAEGGVEPETLRDYVEISLAWRQFIRNQFLEEARPSKQQVEAALAEDKSGNSVSVLLSEVIIPFTPQTQEDVSELAEQISAIKGYDEFSDAAARYSAAETRFEGGQLDWLALDKLPPPLQPLILALSPGQTTQPITLPNAVAVFQMRGISEITGGTPGYSKIDYAAYYIAGGRSPETLQAAAALKTRVDTCDDLYGVAYGQPPSVLDREDVSPGQIPRDIALELAKMDPGEVSTALTRNNGQTLVFLMLCSRTAAANAELTPDDMAAALTDQRVTQLAQGYLNQLRANALIIEQ